MNARLQVLPEPLRRELVAFGDALHRQLPLDETVLRTVPLLHAVPPESIVQGEREIVAAARLYHGAVQVTPGLRWQSVIQGLVRKRETLLQQLERVDELEHLLLFHGDGHFREAALRKIQGPLPSAFLFAAIAWRLNDWVSEVRAAAAECAERCFPITPPHIVAPAIMALLRREHSWGRWTSERLLVAATVTRSDVANVLTDMLTAQRSGPAAAVLRQALRTTAVDSHLPRMAGEAVQPGVRALAALTLIDGYATWPDGWDWQWIDKSLGKRRMETRFGRRNLALNWPRQPLIEACAQDRAAMVRRVAVTSLIRYSLLSPEARRIATALADDPSRAVRERAAFILQRNAEVSSA